MYALLAVNPGLSHSPLLSPREENAARNFGMLSRSPAHANTILAHQQCGHRQRSTSRLKSLRAGLRMAAGFDVNPITIGATCIAPTALIWSNEKLAAHRAHHMLTSLRHVSQSYSKAASRRHVTVYAAGQGTRYAFGGTYSTYSLGLLVCHDFLAHCARRCHGEPENRPKKDRSKSILYLAPWGPNYGLPRKPHFCLLLSARIRAFAGNHEQDDHALPCVSSSPQLR